MSAIVRPAAATSTIDERVCKLICRSNSRAHSIVAYEVDGNAFCAYKSSSEGLWRLNVLEPSVAPERNLKLKGFNYITTSQLHIGLQCFINENYDTLPEFTFDSIQDMFHLRDYPDPGLCESLARVFIRAFGYTHPIAICQILEELNSERNLYRHEVFDPMFYTCSPTCFNPASVQFLFGDRSTSQLRQSSTNSYINRMQHELGLTNEGRLTESVVTILGHQESIYRHVRDAFSRYMEHYFVLQPEESEYVCVIPQIMQVRGGRLRINLKIFSTIIALKTDLTKAFKLYYACYTMPEKEADGITPNPHYKLGGYRAIINIVPRESRLNHLGLNSKFISAGFYVYKIFDYYNPPQLNRGRGAYSKVYNNSYQFAGDLLTEMWPLNLVKERDADTPFLDSTYSTAGGSYKKKTRKYNNRIKRKRTHRR